MGSELDPVGCLFLKFSKFLIKTSGKRLNLYFLFLTLFVATISVLLFLISTNSDLFSNQTLDWMLESTVAKWFVQRMNFFSTQLIEEKNKNNVYWKHKLPRWLYKINVSVNCILWIDTKIQWHRCLSILP